MAETDLTTWLPVHDAATQIGCSKRTVERLAAAKQLEQGLRRQAGSAPIAVYNPEDVARIALERRPDATPFVLGAVPAGNGNGQGHLQSFRETSGSLKETLVRPGDDPIQQFFAVLLRILQSPPPPPASPVAETVAETRIYLTLAEAGQVTGISERGLRQRIRLKTLPAIRDDRQWKVRRTDLEAL